MRTGRPRHVLTTEERRLGQMQGAETKRRRRLTAENLAAEMRAERIVRKRHAGYRWAPPAEPVEPVELAEPLPSSFPPELTCVHGVNAIFCEYCGRNRWKTCRHGNIKADCPWCR